MSRWISMWLVVWALPGVAVAQTDRCSTSCWPTFAVEDDVPVPIDEGLVLDVECWSSCRLELGPGYPPVTEGFRTRVVPEDLSISSLEPSGATVDGVFELEWSRAPGAARLRFAGDLQGDTDYLLHLANSPYGPPTTRVFTTGPPPPTDEGGGCSVVGVMRPRAMGPLAWLAWVVALGALAGRGLAVRGVVGGSGPGLQRGPRLPAR